MKKKNTINVSIDMFPMEDRLNNVVNVNVHTVVEGKVREQLNMDMNLSDPMTFEDFWKNIGKKLEQHMNENQNYFPFGS